MESPGKGGSLAERKKYVEYLERETALQDKSIANELKKLEAMREMPAQFEKQLRKIKKMENVSQSITRSANEYNDALDEGIKKAERAGKELQSMSETIQGYASKIPIIGEGLSKGVQSATDKAKKSIDNWVKESDGSIKKGFKKTGLILGGLLLGTVVAAFAGFLKLLGKAKETMYEFSAAFTETARSLNMSKADVSAIGKGVGDWVQYGAGWASAVAQIRDDMGYIPDLTAKENSLIGKLATNAGLGADQIASMYRTSQRLGVSLNEYVKNQENKINLLNRELGVHFSQAEIVKEISSATDSTLAMFGKQNAELEKQVLIGKKIGLNLNQQASMAKSLLDIESSIESEMEARVLTGKELNFDKARELALNGDISGASAEIMDQVGGINEFNDMNIMDDTSSYRLVYGSDYAMSC